MLIAVLSDIHANREALDAVVEALRKFPVDRTVLLGDLVGYGPDPAYVVEWARDQMKSGAASLQGNHDAAAATGNLSGMSENARDALRWTVAQLTSDQKAFLGALPLIQEVGGILFTHASAWRPQDWRYVRSESDATQSFGATAAVISVCGHTHVPAVFYARPNGKVHSFVPPANKPVPFFSTCRHLIVSGSVGQPRDGNPSACIALLDTDARSITMQRIAYDWERTAEKIVDAGLPAWLGMRLKIGR